MPYAAVWDEAAPVGTAAASDIDLFIRNAKRDVRERIVDVLDVVDFTVDPIVPRALKLNRTANAKILGGTVSLSLRNAADTFDNILITDAGAVTLRSSLALSGAITGATTIAASGAVTVGGTLAVSDAATFSNPITVAPANSEVLQFRAGTGRTMVHNSSITMAGFDRGWVFVQDQTNAQSALILFPGGAVAPIIISQTAGDFYRTTFGTGGRINLDISSGALRIQNLLGSTLTLTTVAVAM